MLFEYLKRSFALIAAGVNINESPKVPRANMNKDDNERFYSSEKVVARTRKW